MGRSIGIIQKPKIKALEILFFLYIFGSYAVPMMGMNSLLLQIPLYAFMGLSWLYILLRYVWLRKSFFVWYVVFIEACLLSIFYSTSMGASIEMIPYLGTAFIFAVSICVFLEHDSSYTVLKYSHIITAIIVGGYLLLNFTQAHWWSRLGESFGMNENLVALYFLIPLCFALTEVKEKRHIIINCFSIGISFVAILLSGSKKALFAVLVFSFMFFWLKSSGFTKKFKIIFGVIIATIIAYQLIMSVPLLYNIMGYRLEAMFKTFQMRSFGNTGSSTAERGDMIQYALRFFLSNPIFGHGINSFKDMYGQITGHFAYAHNNYAELLADLGIIGFSIYYYMYAKFAKQIYYMSHFTKKRNAEFIAFLGVLLFLDLAMVTYYDTRILMIIAIIYKGIFSDTNNDDYYDEIEKV